MPVDLLSLLPKDSETPIETLSLVGVREHLLRLLLSMHLLVREIPPSERLPPAGWVHPSSRVAMPRTQPTLAELRDQWPTPNIGSFYGSLLVHTVKFWRAWSRQNLPCSPGFTLLAPPALFEPQDIECLDGPRTFRVRLAPTGCRPLRERWESAPIKAYREPIPHAEPLDGLSFIVENELQPLKWIHLPPWMGTGAVRPLSARAAVERRAPRVWLFPLEHGKLEFEPNYPQGGRAWTGGFVMKLAEPMTPDHREDLEAELIRIARLVAAHQEKGPSRDVLLFPELCLDEQGVAALRRALREAGARPALMIAGSHHAPVDGHAPVDSHAPLMRALAPIFADGEDEPLWHHRKRGPFRVTGEEWKKMYPKTAGPLQPEDELWEYIVPGDTFTTFDGPGGRVGVLICADLLEERFPAMRDLVRIALVDLLLVVNYSTKTTPFIRHAEQLNRLGVCAVFLNAAGALLLPAHASDPTKGQPIDPFSALVALPQLAPRSAAERPTWLTWRHKDQRVDVQDKKGWLEVLSDGVVAKFHHPAALLVDLNEWLVDPAEPAAYNDPVITALGDAIQAALTDSTRPREDRIAALRAEEQKVLPMLRTSLTGTAQTLLLELYKGGIFVPLGVEHGDTLKTLFAMRLARPHRLAIPATRGDSRETQTNNASAESNFIVSLTPLGRAFVEQMEKAPRSTRLGA